MLRLLPIVMLLFSWHLPDLRTAEPDPEEPVVHAVLFYSPSCGHCHFVIEETFPPLFEEYGKQLSIVGIDVTQPGGQALFLATVDKFFLDHTGVPTLVIGDVVLTGSQEIPEQLPGLIEKFLAEGGVGWPDIPGLAEALADVATPQPPESTTPPSDTPSFLETSTPGTVTTVPTSQSIHPTPTPSGILLTDETDPSLWDRISRDPTGNTMAILVLAGMLGSLGGVVLIFRSSQGRTPSLSSDWLIPLLCTLGLGIAAYLAYVETAQVTAVCGPVGDCNSVQQSEYAWFFGVIPIGVLGLIGYALMILAWSLGRLLKGRLAAYANLAVFGMAAFGTLFSIYLTFLEPFVIGATCIWCLTSAILMTALLWLSAPYGKGAASALTETIKR